MGNGDRLSRFHVIFWLLKDAFWCLGWETLATVMIFPTLAVTLLLLVTEKGERAFNIMLTSWVCMNIFWMLHELWGTPLGVTKVFMLLGAISSVKWLLEVRTRR
jgi:hypothetical protein